MMIRPSVAKNLQNNSDPTPTNTLSGAKSASTSNDARLLGELLRQLLDQKAQSAATETYYENDYDTSVTKKVTETGSDELLQIELDGTVYKLTVTTWQQPQQPEPFAHKDLHQDYRTLNALSPQEHEIVRLVARGLPNKTIASILEISSWTVATHLRRVFAKLEVTTRAAMVARAAEAGLLTP